MPELDDVRALAIEALVTAKSVEAREEGLKERVNVHRTELDYLSEQQAKSNWRIAIISGGIAALAWGIERLSGK